MDSEFARISSLMEADAAKREAISKEVKEINRIFRTIQFTLHAVHNVCGQQKEVGAICQQARQQFGELPAYWQRIFSIVGEENVEKFRGQWRFATEQLVFLAAFTHWLETPADGQRTQLISFEEAMQMIGVGYNEAYALPSAAPAADSAASSTPAAASAAPGAAAASPSTGVGLDLEDYLQGLAALPKELTRLCVNAVRAGVYQLPQDISKFVGDLYSGFRLLNLRNDMLRRKFDSIKYDVAKVEDVLYDISVRKLGTEAAPGSVDTKTLASGGAQQQQQGGEAADVTMQ